MKEIGKMMKEKVKEYFNMLQVINMKDNIVKMLKMDMVYI